MFRCGDCIRSSLLLPTVQTGAYVQTYETRQRNQHRQTTHRPDIMASLPQNIGPTIFNINLEEVS